MFPVPLVITESGEVVLSVQNHGSHKSGEIEFAVSDTGAGIPSEKLETIFDDFTQADASTTRKYGGTGLGLGISRRLVEAMAGRLTAASSVGKGSTFRFTAQFASTLRRDLEAVKLSMTAPWSNGPIEGHINRLKAIKRQMYGRAGFELLKARMLPWETSNDA